MNKQNLDQALAALADALKSEDPNGPDINPLLLIKKFPLRSLSGDHINGGKIVNFSSSGIADQSTKTQLTLSDTGASVTALSVGSIKGNLAVENEITAQTVAATTVRADVLEVKEIKADISFEKDTPVVFSGDVFNKGLLWQGHGYTKQFVFNNGPERFFSSESIDLAKEKLFSINNIPVLSEKELGATVVKSNLRELGRLKGLIVDGSVNIDSFIMYNTDTNRLGIGTDMPNAAVSVLDQAVEIVLGARDTNRAGIGSYNSADLELVTDNTARLTIKAGGNIELGNKNTAPIAVTVNGSLGVGVNVPDSRVKLDVNGSIKFNNKLHLSGTTPPQGGTYNRGDIVWNDEPAIGKPIGWVCVHTGSPGIWHSFGDIR